MRHLSRVLRAPGSLACAVTSLITLSGGVARADAARDVAGRVVELWHGAGARTSIVPARFLFDEESVLVPIPTEADGTESECTQVAIIGARGLSFRARLSDAPMDPLLPQEPMARASSTAGVLELRRCDKARPSVRHVILSTEAGRGAVEILVGRSDRPLPALSSLIPERTGGAIPPMPEAGALPPLAAQPDRAKAAEARIAREGSTVHARSTARAGDDGSGEAELDLDEGCHRIEAFGRELVRDRPGRRFRLDLDAELRDGERLLARDRTEGPDARLEACVGSPTRVTLAFAGAPPHSDVVITQGTWPLPARIPTMWGPEARSRIAKIMFVRHIAVPPDDPVYLAQGSTGSEPTPLPLSVETGGCYVAVVGVTRGRARQLQLRALVGARESTDERGAAEEAALSAFCIRAHESARLEVLAKGSGVTWGVALFRVKSKIWEAGL
jgi:hypothetical protein